MMQVRLSRQVAKAIDGMKLPYVVNNLLINKETGLPVELVITGAAME